MATCIPPFPRKNSTSGEKRVFRALKQLDDDCVVYFEPMINSKQPDFIVIIPEAGVLILEIKDWPLENVESVDAHRVTLRNQDFKNPIAQARNYMNDLRDACRKSPFAPHLKHHSGQYKGQYTFAFASGAVFSSSTTKALEPQKGVYLFDPNETFTSDDIATWEKSTALQLRKSLTKSFPPRFSEPLSQSQMDIIRSVIHPEIMLSATPTALRLLDMKQEQILKKNFSGHRILSGVTGSGKTIILLGLAKARAQQEDAKILVLCRERLLNEYFARELEQHANIKALTFSRWGQLQELDYIEGEQDDDFAKRLLATLEKGSPERNCYDAVFVDEAQDLSQDTLKCCTLALKDPRKGDLLLVGDGNQRLFRQRRFRWKDAGVFVQGRVTYLTQNCRNTAQIFKAAGHILRPKKVSDLDENAFEPGAVDFQNAARRGSFPDVVYQLQDRPAECDYAAAQLELWLKRGLQTGTSFEKVNPQDIAIIYPFIPETEMQTFEAFHARLTKLAPVAVFDHQRHEGKVDDRSIKLLTFGRCRGLQFPIVILIWTDLAAQEKFPEENIRRLLYVGMTRAQNHLVILHSNKCQYIEELSEFLSEELD